MGNGFDNIPDWRPGNSEDEHEFDPNVGEENDAGAVIEILLIGGTYSGRRIMVDVLSENEVLIDFDTREMESYQQDKPGCTNYFFDRDTTRKLNANRDALFKKLSFQPREMK